MDQGVRSSVALDLGVRFAESGQCPFLHGEIGLDVLMSSYWAFMPKPKRNHTDVDTCLQQVHWGDLVFMAVS